MTNPSGAKFTISTTPSTDGGFDAIADQNLPLQLEASPALDVHTCKYTLHLMTSGGPTITLSSGGIATPPTAAITLPIPSDDLIYSFAVRCQTNNGEGVFNSATGKNDDYTVNTFERIVSVRGQEIGLRKIVIGERLEYDPVRGWTEAINEMVDALETLIIAVGNGTPNSRSLTAGAGLTGGGDLSANRTFNVGQNADNSITVNANDIQLKAAYQTLLDGATAASTASTLAKRGASGEVAFGVATVAGLVVGTSGKSTFASSRADAPQVVPHASTITFDGKDGNVVGSGGNFCQVTLTGNATLAAPTNYDAGAQLTFHVRQDVVGGHSLNMAAFTFSTGVTTTLIGTLNGATDVLKADFDGTVWNIWHHSVYAT